MKDNGYQTQECLGVWLWLFLKKLFVSKLIKMMFFFIFKKLFLRSAHQNDRKQTKKLIFNKKNIFLTF